MDVGSIKSLRHAYTIIFRAIAGMCAHQGAAPTTDRSVLKTLAVPSVALRVRRARFRYLPRALAHAPRLLLH
eukprot:3019649-Lingulodinium_polyedra.AAC.1